VSKFAPKTAAKPAAQPPSDEAIDRVVAAAAPDAPPAEKKAKAKDVVFSMSLPAEMAAAIDESCERLGLTRTAWLRLAAAEKLGWR